MRARPALVSVAAAVIVLGSTSTAFGTFPGDSGEIAYLPRPDINHTPALRTIHPDGTDGRLLIRGDPSDFPTSADWSPDGSTLAVYLHARGRIVLLDPDTGNRSLVARTDDIVSASRLLSIAFAPTGDALVACVTRRVRIDEYPFSFERPRLYTMDLDGSNITAVSKRPDCFADWSSTGRLVATNGWGRANKIVTMDPDGSDRDVVVASPGRILGKLTAVAPSWSPDGSRFVYAAKQRGEGKEERYDLFVVDDDGTNRERLTDTPSRSEYSALFSPDATTLVFVRTSSFYFNGRPPIDIFSISSNGSALRRLTDTPNRDELTQSWQALPP